MNERGAILSTWRQMSLVGGIVSILLGIVLLLWPGRTLLVVASLLGLWLIILGIIRLADAVTGRELPGSSRWFSVLAGVVYLLAGIVVLANLDASLKFFALLIGLIWIFSGASEIIAGITRVRGAAQKAGAIIIGLVNVALGLLVLFWPGISLVVLVWITAIWLIVIGLIQLYFAWRAGKAAKEAQDSAYHVIEGL
ncbi:MAG: HdeD family acid-resistance protein [Hamadaea sp.]|nr:HdeD family acid-resistance protein [Hamadaea sp.]